MEGISNIYIKDVVTPHTKHFEGVYSCETIPSSLKSKDKFSIIVNLSKSNERGTHWVAIFKDKDKLIYYDPIGFPLINPHIKAFLECIKQDYQYNLFEYQCMKSKFCGFFTILFSILMEQDMTFKQYQSLFSKNCKDNNKRVIDLLKYTIEKLYFLCISCLPSIQRARTPVLYNYECKIFSKIF